MEIWKKVFDGNYEVSNNGNVRRATSGISTFIGRPLIPSYSSGGYLQVMITVYGRSKRFYVHHLVMLAFVGDRPNGYIVNHKDCDKTNNAIENLEYLTQKQNNIHAFKIKGRNRGPKKEKILKGKQIGASHWMRRHPEKIRKGEELKSKLSANQILEIREKRNGGMLYKDICKKYGISMAHVSRICLKKHWRHIQ